MAACRCAGAAGWLRGGGRMTAYPSLMPKYRRTAALACIASQMTMTGPGISRSPASQRRTVRPLSTRTRRAKASAERPRLCRIDLRSAGVIVGRVVVGSLAALAQYRDIGIRHRQHGLSCQRPMIWRIQCGLVKVGEAVERKPKGGALALHEAQRRLL